MERHHEALESFIESIDSRFHDSLRQGIALAEEGIVSLNNITRGTLTYHARPYRVEGGVLVENHTRRIVAFTIQLVRALERGSISVPDHEKVAVLLAGYWHDIYQDTRVGLERFEGRMIEKLLRQNGNPERRCATALLKFMGGENERLGEELYTPETMGLAEKSILLTIPLFVAGGVEQAIKPTTPLTARLVPLADLGEVGLTGSVGSAIRLMCEDYPQVADAILKHSWKGILQRPLLAAIRDFIQSQERFVAHRQARLPYDLTGLPENAQAALRAEFRHFDEFTATTRAMLTAANEMAFSELVDYLGSLISA